MEPGRNMPCPCGSGKKYKHCCLAAARAAASDPSVLAWKRLRRLREGFPERMLGFMHDAYGGHVMEEAWEAFMLDDGAPFDPDSPHFPVFCSWMFHHWAPRAEDSDVADASLHGVAPTRAFLQRKGRHLDAAMRQYLQACVDSHYSFFEVEEVERGRSLDLLDLITGRRHHVWESSGTETLKAGDFVYGLLADSGGVTLAECLGPCAFPPHHKLRVIDLRQQLYGDGPPTTSNDPRRHAGSLRELYLQLIEELFHPPLPKLQNTDGEDLEALRLVFDIDSPQTAFDALKHLDFDTPEDVLLADARRDHQGRLQQVAFTWKQQGNALHSAWDNTVLGHIRIKAGRLTVEVNSRQRAERARTIVEQTLGNQARYRATKVESVAAMMARARQAAPVDTRRLGQSELMEMSEVRAKIAELMERHYQAWLDAPLPALGNRTPREAARDTAGRERVEALVRQIERDGPTMEPPLDPAIPRFLREKLRLDRPL
jgi:hypothetical protein